MQPPSRTTPWNENTAFTIFAAMAPNQRAPILKLPGELRNEIYRLSLLQDEPISMVHSGRVDGPGEPGLLAVCKQIRNETCGIWYEENTFSYEETPGTFGYFAITRLARWLRRIGPERCAKLKQLLLTYRAKTARHISNKPHRFRISYPLAENAQECVSGLLAASVGVDVIKIDGPRDWDGLQHPHDWRPHWTGAMETALNKASRATPEELARGGGPLRWARGKKWTPTPEFILEQMKKKTGLDAEQGHCDTETTEEKVVAGGWEVVFAPSSHYGLPGIPDLR